jgi:hypothetical protein
MSAGLERPQALWSKEKNAMRALLPKLRRSGPKTLVQDLEKAIEVEQATRRSLQYFVVPLWIATGLADWYSHRRTHIETTAGARESALHALMMVEAGIPATLGLFLDVNAGVLLAAFAGFAAHELTAIWDVAYAEGRREVTDTEQHIHSFLEVTPLLAVSFLTVLHWDQALALIGRGPARPDFRLRLKRRPLSRRYIAGLLASIGAFVVLPYAEELWRCYRANPTLAAQPETKEAPTEAIRVPAEER